MFVRRRAEFRYRIANASLVYGLFAVVSSIPLMIVTWGLTFGKYIAAYVASGLLALAIATALGLYNLYYLKRNAPPPPQARIFE